VPLSALTARRPGLDPATGELADLELAAREHFQFIWRCLRRLGVQPDHSVDDAAQRVFEIAALKRAQIAVGAERAFLFKTAVLVAAEERRRRRRDAREELDEDAVLEATTSSLGPDEAAEANRWRSRLDSVLNTLSLELRTVFVLYEFERLSSPEIAEWLGLPLGTVASRLRRARAEFQAAARRLQAKLRIQGDSP
jgi:RNA polymerase sigma-70 factor (ECF subfamily)